MAKSRGWKSPDVVPSLFYADVAAAAAWLTRVFGFSERRDARLSWPGGGMTWIELGGGLINLTTTPEARTAAPPVGMSAGLKVYVDDVDAHFARARRRGAHIVLEPQDGFWGGRIYRAADLEGHVWEFAQRDRDLAAADWQLPDGVRRGLRAASPPPRRKPRRPHG